MLTLGLILLLPYVFREYSQGILHFYICFMNTHQFLPLVFANSNIKNVSSSIDSLSKDQSKVHVYTCYKVQSIQINNFYFNLRTPRHRYLRTYMLELMTYQNSKSEGVIVTEIPALKCIFLIPRRNNFAICKPILSTNILIDRV